MQPTPEAWLFARKQARIHGYAGDGPDAVSFAAGWLAGIAEGRRQAAEAIRAFADEIESSIARDLTAIPDMPRDSVLVLGGEHGMAVPLRFLAARIAEGKEDTGD